MTVKIAPINRNNNPVNSKQCSLGFLSLPIFRSRYCLYVSWFFLPMGIKALNTFFKTKPIPIKPPSLLTNIMPANSVSKSPETKNPSDKICIFTPVSSVKKPFIQKMINVINEAMPKHTAYLISTALVSGLRPFLSCCSTLLFSCSTTTS